MEGFLLKQGQRNRAWRRRYFRLKGHHLEYSCEPDDGRPLGAVNLRGAVSKLREQYGEDGQNTWLGASEDRCFVIVTSHRIYLLQAESANLAREWVSALQTYADEQALATSGQIEWSVVIVSAQDNGSFVEYEILATHPLTGTTNRSKHRYSSLYRMHQQLEAMHPEEMADITFPPKKVLGARAPSFVELRQGSLNRYLQALAASPLLVNDPLVRETLRLKESGVPREARLWLNALTPARCHLEHSPKPPRAAGDGDTDATTVTSASSVVGAGGAAAAAADTVAEAKAALAPGSSVASHRPRLGTGPLISAFPGCTVLELYLAGKHVPSCGGAEEGEAGAAESATGTRCSLLMRLPQDDTDEEHPGRVVYEDHHNGSLRRWHVLGTTDTAGGSTPVYRKPIRTPYIFDKPSDLRVVMWKGDAPALSPAAIVGEGTVALAAVVTAGDALRLELSPAPAVVLIHAQPALMSNFSLRLRLSAFLPGIDKPVFAELRSDTRPLVHSSECLGDDGAAADAAQRSAAAVGGEAPRDFVSIHRTNHVVPHTMVHWEPFSVEADDLCQGCPDRNVQIVIKLWNEQGMHEFLCRKELTVRELVSNGCGAVLAMQPHAGPKSAAADSSTREGPRLVVEFVNLTFVPHFIDHIKGGSTLEVTFAIDMTASNGAVEDPKSLHYLRGSKDNEYISVIKHIGSLLAPYSADQKMSVFGFGAAVKGQGGTVSQCFPLNFDWDCPEVDGVEGVLSAYKSALSKVDLYGPTNLTEIIDQGILQAKESADRLPAAYRVLVIITDGTVTDAEATSAALAKASTLPMSVVLVGVGPSDFSQSREFGLPRNQAAGQRHMTTFVSFRDIPGTIRRDPKAMAEFTVQALRPIPEQFSAWARHHSTGKPKRIAGGLSERRPDFDLASTVVDDEDAEYGTEEDEDEAADEGGGDNISIDSDKAETHSRHSQDDALE